MSMYNSEDDILVTKLEDLKVDLSEIKNELMNRYESDDSDLSSTYLERIMRSIDDLISDI